MTATSDTPETMTDFVSRLGILCTANKVRGAITCRACRGTGTSKQGKWMRCADCKGTSTRAPKDTDDWRDSAVEWRVVLQMGGRMLEVPFWTGVGITDTPTAADILNCLADDAHSATDSFDDWCANMGYDTDSRKALETYTECQRIGGKLRTFLGNHDAYETLLYNVERL